MNELGIRLEDMLKKSGKWVHAVVQEGKDPYFDRAVMPKVAASSDAAYPIGSDFHVRVREKAQNNEHSILISPANSSENKGYVIANGYATANARHPADPENALIAIAAGSSDQKLWPKGRLLDYFAIDRVIRNGYSFLLLNRAPNHPMPRAADPAPSSPI